MSRISKWWSGLAGVGQVLVVGLCLMFALNLVVIGNTFRDTAFDEPLSGYERELAQEEFTTLEPVRMSSQRCNDYDQTIHVTYQRSWRTADPNDQVVVPGGGGNFELAPGCSSGDVKYPIPPGVVAYTEAALAEGRDGVEWIIEGIETPIDEEGDVGQIKIWQTEPFKVK